MATEILRPNTLGDECNIDRQDGAACPNHYLNVDEVDPDEHTTRNFTKSTTWLRDLYNIQDHSVGSGTINKITVYARCYRPIVIGASYSAKICIKTSGTAYEGPEFPPEEAVWRTYSEEWAINPKTGEKFTWDEIDNLQIGIALRSCDLPAEEYTFCTQMYVEVDYTPIVVPTVTTDPATAVGRTTATLNGTLDDDGEEACDVRFQYGETIAYGINTAWQLGKESVVAFAQAITGLSPNTTYHFRAQARNSAGTVNGDDRTFTTNPALAINRAYALAREEL